jgi:hypothetical protein
MWRSAEGRCCATTGRHPSNGALRAVPNPVSATSTTTARRDTAATRRIGVRPRCGVGAARRAPHDAPGVASVRSASIRRCALRRGPGGVLRPSARTGRHGPPDIRRAAGRQSSAHCAEFFARWNAGAGGPCSARRRTSRHARTPIARGRAAVAPSPPRKRRLSPSSDARGGRQLASSRTLCLPGSLAVDS